MELQSYLEFWRVLVNDELWSRHVDQLISLRPVIKKQIKVHHNPQHGSTMALHESGVTQILW